MIELSEDLVTWTTDPNLVDFVSRIDHGDGTATFTYRADPPWPPKATVYMRLRVTTQ